MIAIQGEIFVTGKIMVSTTGKYVSTTGKKVFADRNMCFMTSKKLLGNWKRVVTVRVMWKISLYK